MTQVTWNYRYNSHHKHKNKAHAYNSKPYSVATKSLHMWLPV